MARRWRMGILLLLLLPLVTGCWDRVEINDVAIVGIVGLDVAEQGIRVSAKVITPQGSPAGGAKGGQTRPAITLAGEGETFTAAVDYMQRTISRRIFWSHARVLVVSEELARQGVQSALDFWTRHREPRLGARMVVVKGRAEDFLGTQPRLDRLLSDAVRETVSIHLQAEITVKDFIIGLRAQRENAVLPYIDTETLGDPAKGIRVHGTALFRADRMVGWLNPLDTQAMLWVRNESRYISISFPIFAAQAVALSLSRVQTQVRPLFRGDRPYAVELDMTVDADLFESAVVTDYGKLDAIHGLEEKASKAMADRVKRMVEKTQQELQTDVLRLGDSVRHRNPRWWEAGGKKQWDEIYPDLEIRIKVTVHINTVGEHGEPIALPPDQSRDGGS